MNDETPSPETAARLATATENLLQGFAEEFLPALRRLSAASAEFEAARKGASLEDLLAVCRPDAVPAISAGYHLAELVSKASASLTTLAHG